MKFEEQFEAIVRFVDGTVNLYVFNSYEDAFDGVMRLAMQNLPEENVLVFQINKSFRNVAIKQE